MRLRSFVLAACVFCPLFASAADGTNPLTANRKRVESVDYRGKGHMARVDANGTRTNYGVALRAHWFPGVLRVLLEIESPAQAREHVLLEMHADGRSTITVAHPGDTAPTPLPFEKWTDGPLGDQFSYEDFLEASSLWSNQSSLGVATFGGRTCDQVKSVPAAADKTHIASVKSCLDQVSGFPVHVEKTMKGSGAVKEFTYFGLRQTSGVWVATQIEAKVHGRPGSTLLVIDRGSAKAHLSLQDFSLAQLTHF